MIIYGLFHLTLIYKLKTKQMKNVKQIGIWMDHSNAFFMEQPDENTIHRMIASKFTHQEKESSLSKNENLMHNKEQQLQSSYFNKIADIIKNYQEVLLFGPTDAKSELLNLLKKDHLFDAIKFQVKQSDKMTEKQMNEFVTAHFK